MRPSFLVHVLTSKPALKLLPLPPDTFLRATVRMATEDERYRQSSQFRLWSFSPARLQELRAKTNSLAKQQVAARTEATLDFLTPDEETRLVKFITVELIRAAQFCELPTEIRSTAAMFLRRFYITNSVMTYPPTELLKTCLFFGCKAEGFYIRLAKLAEKFPNTTSEQILAGEFLLCQGIRFAFDVRHPFRALEGAILELRRLRPDEEARIIKAHARAREILKFSALMTDAYFHFTPSQIMMAALLIVDPGLVDDLIPKPKAGEVSRVSADVYDKIMATIESCRVMLGEEPPERMSDYWGLMETLKSVKQLRKKLQKCRDPDRADLVALQRARREQAVAKPAKTPGTAATNDGVVFGAADRDAKRRKVGATEDPFGPSLSVVKSGTGCEETSSPTVGSSLQNQARSLPPCRSQFILQMADRKIVLITGANTGLGYQMVRALCGSDKAYEILVGGRSMEKAEKAVEEAVAEFPSSKSRVSAIQVDVESDDSIQAAFDKVKSDHGRLDGLVNNAGATFDQHIQSNDMTMRQAWNQSWNVNTTGSQVMTHVFVPLLLRSTDARLLFVTSGTSTLTGSENRELLMNKLSPKGWPKTGLVPNQMISSYRSAKAGLNMMMREWHRHLSEDGVKVWAISPGYLATGLGGSVERNRKQGAGDPVVAGEFVRDVLEGRRDRDVGMAIARDGRVQAW
ncbi:hypothetical protein L249_0152 [Ophiocordyceps polyrhachis-furcata BCC 54312]|uniref:Cyclin-like domain-containing protein n=1 Tax=Ophiocordyceps polyrhachis-furcata BCC 54312 TaxID=1330021 RepID=A0A367LDB1_9HYPO|nr:hypothetical protein L249_0152 [Ophiocordyceps polyrhachis-furcata BCC 54312]